MNMDILIDSKTPLNSKLRGIYKQTHAHFTLKERLPIILTQVIDYLVRENDSICANSCANAAEELKEIIGEISKLKYELQTNKPLRVLDTCGTDEHLWNPLIEDENSTYFQTVWLYAECYIYRRLRQAFAQSTCFQSYDPFRHQKIENFTSSRSAITIITAFLQQSLPSNFETFEKFIKLSLWGNTCDLSLTLGKNVAQVDDPFQGLEKLNPKILVNQTSQVWEILKDKERLITIVTDNAGYEIFTDLALADYLISTNLAKEIRFQIKNMPWFISDVTLWDFNYVLDNCQPKLGQKWKNWVAEKKWIIETEHFWTSPYEYSKMERRDPELYEKLSKSDLIIFKGDLNYRKLLGDFNWEPTTSFKKALNGFCPTNLCTLRTNKADLIAGVSGEVVEKMEGDWLVSGEFAIIEAANKEL